MDRVTGQEVEFHLGILHARQDGQAIVWVAVTLLLVVALFVAGTGIAQLMLFRWDAQGAADAAALAGANIQAQALMSLAFLDTLVYARNATISALYTVAAVLGVICAACIIGIGCWACPVAIQVATIAFDFQEATEEAVQLIKAFQKVIQWVFPFYASANATWYGWKNGALALGLPLPVPLSWPKKLDNGTPDPAAKMEELNQQLTEINNCLDMLKEPGSDSSVFRIPDDIKQIFARLQSAYERDDLGDMRRALRDLKNSALRSRMDLIIETIDRMMAPGGQCHVATVDQIMARGLQCSAEVTCKGKTETVCTQHSAPSRAGFISTLEHLRQDAREIQEWLDRIDDCLADKNNEDCVRNISSGLLDAYHHLEARAKSIQDDFLKARAEKMRDCMDCVGKAIVKTDDCRLKELDEGTSKLWALEGIFVVVWRRNTNESKGVLDADSRLWRGQSVGAVYSAAYATPARVEDSDGKCHRCLLQSVSLGPLKDIPLLQEMFDALTLILNILVGQDTKYCKTPEWARNWVISGILSVLRTIAGLIGRITEFFTGMTRPDVCERRPILTRVDAGLTVGLGLETQRGHLVGKVLEQYELIIKNYNDPAQRWNQFVQDYIMNPIENLGILDFFPEDVKAAIEDVLRHLPLPLLPEKPNLTGPLF